MCFIRRVFAVRPLCAETQEREYFGKVHKTFGLSALAGRQRFSAILAVKQFLQAFVHSEREFELVKITRHL
jgi:hypothetical protein